MKLSTIEITAPVLPTVLPTDQQALMNLFYNHWQALSKQVSDNNAALSQNCSDVSVNYSIPGMLRAPLQSEIAAVMPPKVNAAVILGNFNYQTTNGGFGQYDDNGYSASVDALRTLYKGAYVVGIEGAGEVFEMIEEFIQRKADDNAPRDMLVERDDDGNEVEYEDDSFDNFDDLNKRYYAKDREPLMQEILNQFYEVTAAGFMAGAFRLAA